MILQKLQLSDRKFSVSQELTSTVMHAASLALQALEGHCDPPTGTASPQSSQQCSPTL